MLRARLATQSRSIESDRDSAVAAAVEKERGEFSKRLRSIEKGWQSQLVAQRDDLTRGFEKRFTAYQHSLSDHSLLSAQRIAQDQVKEMAAQLTIQEIMLAAHRNELSCISEQLALAEEARAERSPPSQADSKQLLLLSKKLAESERAQETTAQVLTLYINRAAEAEDECKRVTETARLDHQDATRKLLRTQQIANESFQVLGNEYRTAALSWHQSRAELVQLLRYKDEVVARQDESVSRLLFENGQLLKQLQQLGVFNLGAQVAENAQAKEKQSEAKRASMRMTSGAAAATHAHESDPPSLPPSLQTSPSQSSHSFGNVRFIESSLPPVVVPELAADPFEFYTQLVGSGAIQPLNSPLPEARSSTTPASPGWPLDSLAAASPGVSAPWTEARDSVSVLDSPGSLGATLSNSSSVREVRASQTRSATVASGASSHASVPTAHAGHHSIQAPVRSLHAQAGASEAADVDLAPWSADHTANDFSFVPMEAAPHPPQHRAVQPHQSGSSSLVHSASAKSVPAYGPRPSVPAGQPLATGHSVVVREDAQGRQIIEATSSAPAPSGPYSSLASTASSPLSNVVLPPDALVGMSQEWKTYHAYRSSLATSHPHFPAAVSAKPSPRLRADLQHSRDFQSEEEILRDSELARTKELQMLAEPDSRPWTASTDGTGPHVSDGSLPAPLPNYMSAAGAAAAATHRAPAPSRTVLHPVALSLEIPAPLPTPQERHQHAHMHQQFPPNALAVHGATGPPPPPQRSPNGLTPLANQFVAAAIQSSLPIGYKAHTAASGVKQLGTWEATPSHSCHTTGPTPPQSQSLQPQPPVSSSFAIPGVGFQGSISAASDSGSPSARVKDLRGKRMRQTMAQRAKPMATVQPQPPSVA